MTKFAKMMAVCGCCCGLALVGCQTTRSVDASGAECGADCQDKCGKTSTVDVQAGESKCCKEGAAASTVDVQASECTKATSCSGGSCSAKH